MTNFKENIIHESKDSQDMPKREGFEMSAEQAGEIASELSKLDDAITHDQPISIEDLEDLGKVAKGTKIDVGGEIMTVEEAEKNPDLKMNLEIWKEMKEGNFENIGKLTRITREVSKCLENIKGSIDLGSLTSAEGLNLPQNINRSLYLNNLTSAEGLNFPKSIGFDLELNSLISSKGLNLPKSVGGCLNLNSITSAEVLKLPDTIGDRLFLRGLTSADGLILPNSIGGGLNLRGLASAEKEKLIEKYPQYKHKIE